MFQSEVRGTKLFGHLYRSIEAGVFMTFWDVTCDDWIRISKISVILEGHHFAVECLKFLPRGTN